jgi:Ran GTPase-activating protein (RanGAP) involved in mRNA processing and transport
LHGNQITYAGCKELANALISQNTLKHLDLGTNPIGDAGICELILALVHNTTLEQLNIGNTYMEQKALVTIADMLQENKTLRALNIESPILFSVSEETTIHLAKALGVNNTLHTLYMGKHRMRDHGARWMAKYLAKNTALTCLNLRCNRLTMTGVSALAEALAERSHNVECTIELADNMLKARSAAAVDAVIDKIHDAVQPNVPFMNVEFAVSLDDHVLRSAMCVAQSEEDQQQQQQQQHGFVDEDGKHYADEDVMIGGGAASTSSAASLANGSVSSSSHHVDHAATDGKYDAAQYLNE